MISRNSPKAVSEAEAFRRLASLCAKAEHCSGEADEKMRRWGIDEAARQRVIGKLVEGRYIDDGRFCRSFVNDKIHYDHWGRRKIEQALRVKRVPTEVSAPVLDAVPDDDYLQVLRPLLRAKWPTIKAATDYERSAKLIKYAMGRGFTLDLIRQCVDQAVDEVGGLDDE
jgi:regulatory protein